MRFIFSELMFNSVIYFIFFWEVMNQHKTLELKDPGNTRQVNTIPLPYQRSLTREQLLPGGNPNYKLLQKFLKR